VLNGVIFMSISKEKCMDTFGCTPDHWSFLRSLAEKYHKTPIKHFSSQKACAKRRCIEWELTLWEWWEIWRDSGKYLMRGQKKDKYVMARYADEGPYSKNNVYITTAAQNRRDYEAKAYGPKKLGPKKEWDDYID